MEHVDEKNWRDELTERAVIKVDLTINPATGKASGTLLLNGLLAHFLTQNEDLLPRVMAMCSEVFNTAFCDSYDAAKREILGREQSDAFGYDGEEDN